MHALSKEQGRARMTQVMQADGGQPGVSKNRFEITM